jgi:hypothetical protein
VSHENSLSIKANLSYLTMAEAVPATPLSTFLKLYELNDHYGGSYASPMTAYQSASPTEIWTLLNNSTPLQAGAFIGMSQVQGTTGGLLYVVSGLQRQAAVLVHTDSFDGRTFAFIGEPFRGLVDSVELFKDPNITMTRCTTLSLVPTDEQITATWEAEPNAPMIGPFDTAADAGIDPYLVADQTCSIRTRVLMWILQSIFLW